VLVHEAGSVLCHVELVDEAEGCELPEVVGSQFLDLPREPVPDLTGVGLPPGLRPVASGIAVDGPFDVVAGDAGEQRPLVQAEQRLVEAVRAVDGMRPAGQLEPR
jgi:hypothetical protein